MIFLAQEATVRTLLSLKKWLPPVASATAVAMLIAFMPATAGAASVTTATPLLGSMLCFGSLTNSTDTTDLPDGDLTVLGAYLQRIKTDIAPFPSVPATVTITLGWYVDATCTTLSANGQKATAATDPCVQASYATGSYIPAAKGTFPNTSQPNILTANFVEVGQSSPNSQPGVPHSDPFGGCTATFQVLPYAKGTASNMTFTGLSGSCKMSGSEISLACENH